MTVTLTAGEWRLIAEQLPSVRYRDRMELVGRILLQCEPFPNHEQVGIDVSLREYHAVGTAYRKTGRQR